MRLFALSALAACLTVSTAFAQSNPPDPDLKKVVGALAAAQRAGDDQTWGRYTTDDFLVVEPDGVVKTKSERMAEIKGRTQQGAAPAPTAPAPTEDKWRMYGTTAIRTLRTTIDNRPTRVTMVWVKQSGDWKAASVHLSTIEKP
jgi:ketosteroid isomerase-like protein